MAIKHAFTSAIEDGVDDTLVQPSNWNADHTGSNLIVEEADGTPTISGVVKIKVASGTLTEDGSGVVSLDFSGSGMTNPMTTSGDIIYGGVDGSPTRLAGGTEGQVLTMGATNPAWAAASGGVGTPTVVQSKNAGTQVTQIVLDSAPTEGNRLLLFSNSTTGQITNVACTNVTWTQIATAAATSYFALWVGVVGAGASATITFTKPGTYNYVGVVEVTDALTPTLSTYSFVANNSFQSIQGLSSGDFVVCAMGVDNTVLTCKVFPLISDVAGLLGAYPISIGVCYVPETFMTVATTYGGIGATLIAKIT